jgi:hypothetical protein
MDYTQALKALKDSEVENADAIVKAISDRFKELSAAETKAKELSSLLDSTLDLLQVEGADQSSRHSSASQKIKQLQEAQKNLEQALIDKSTQIEQFSHQLKIKEITEKTGANPKLLSLLIKNEGLKAEDIKIEGTAVKIKDEDFKVYSEKNWGELQSALFPGQQQHKQTETSLPTGSSKGATSPEDKAPEDLYLQKAYAGFSKLLGGNN